MTYFGGAVNRNNFYFLILLFTSLHVSASIGHPQVKYTFTCLKAITTTQRIKRWSLLAFRRNKLVFSV
jgi:hypothetical protein